MKEFIKNEREAIRMQTGVPAMWTMFFSFAILAGVGEMIWGRPGLLDYVFFWYLPDYPALDSSNIIGILYQTSKSTTHLIFNYAVYLLGPIISLFWHGLRNTLRGLAWLVYCYVAGLITLCLIVLFAILFGGKKKK